MKQGTRQGIPTVAEVVKRAAVVCDPPAADIAVTALIESFEDDDRPATAVEDLPGQLGSTVGGIDPEAESPAAAVAAALAAWLVHHSGDTDDRETLIREGVRFGFGDRPPDYISAWLDEEGVAV
jgi:hypothetical protein